MANQLRQPLVGKAEKRTVRGEHVQPCEQFSDNSKRGDSEKCQDGLDAKKKQNQEVPHQE